MITLGTMTCEFEKVICLDNEMRADICFKCFLGGIYIFDLGFLADEYEEGPNKICGMLVHNNGYDVALDNQFEDLVTAKLKDIVNDRYKQFVEWIDVAHPGGEDLSDSPEAI